MYSATILRAPTRSETIVYTGSAWVMLPLLQALPTPCKVTRHFPDAIVARQDHEPLRCQILRLLLDSRTPAGNSLSVWSTR